MEDLVKAFVRVQRGIDDGEALCKALPDLEALALSDPSLVSDQDRRRVLDLPEPEMQAAYIATATSLSEEALMERAARSPELLTPNELEVLVRRCWGDLTLREAGCESETNMSIVNSHSQAYWEEITARLRTIREALYQGHEAEAFENASHEFYRRVIEAAANKPEDPRMAQARPWVRQLWDEIKGSPKMHWGYAVFQPPDQQFDNYMSLQSGYLRDARRAICCGSDLGIRWLLQPLEWPSPLSSTEDAPLEPRLEALRQEFKAVRAVSQSADSTTVGLRDGILHNTFLVIDPEAMRNVTDGMFGYLRMVDNMWVWAVDPDWTPDDNEETNEHPEYRGYMRVRLQQLVNNFFERRRFHADEPLERLWEAAAVSRHQAFVSVKEDEARLYSSSSGSALKP